MFANMAACGVVPNVEIYNQLIRKHARLRVYEWKDGSLFEDNSRCKVRCCNHDARRGEFEHGDTLASERNFGLVKGNQVRDQSGVG